MDSQAAWSPAKRLQANMDDFTDFCRQTPDNVLRWRKWLDDCGFKASKVRTYLATLASFDEFVAKCGVEKRNPAGAEILHEIRPYSSGRYLSGEDKGALL